MVICVCNRAVTGGTVSKRQHRLTYRALVPKPIFRRFNPVDDFKSVARINLLDDFIVLPMASGHIESAT